MDSVVPLTNWMLDLHGARWERKQRAEFARGNERKTIGTELLRGEGFAAFNAQIERLFWHRDEWARVKPSLKTVRLRSLATACLARAQGGIKQLVVDDTQQLPHVLQRLLIDPGSAEELRAIPECRWRSYSKRFFQRYNTAERMRSDDALAEVFLIAWLHTRCQVLLESRFSFVRSLVHHRCHTWKKTFCDLATEYFLCQQRLGEGSSSLAGEGTKRCASTKPRKRRRDGRFAGHLTGGGGRRRGALSHLYDKSGRNVGSSMDGRKLRRQSRMP